ncbi:MAG: GNAT family N-acetyltransferase [Chloroflexi bacterium]|nr:GNAT family N-acetyltransferase [Chloroflexota bacterium]
MLKVRTKRLNLIPLTLKQSSLYLDAPQQLEQELNFSISRSIVTERLRRAIEIKVSRMTQVGESVHPWYTYWLVVIAQEPFGAGQVGFKGYPDKDGEVEIGYGIDPSCQGKGYTTEAVRALITWTFKEPDCKSIVAPDTKKRNLASNRVLEKVGMHIYNETDDALFWRIDKNDSL